MQRHFLALCILSPFVKDESKINFMQWEAGTCLFFIKSLGWLFDSMDVEHLQKFSELIDWYFDFNISADTTLNPFVVQNDRRMSRDISKIVGNCLNSKPNPTEGFFFFLNKLEATTQRAALVLSPPLLWLWFFSPVARDKTLGLLLARQVSWKPQSLKR